MSNRMDKHLTLSRLQDKIKQLKQEIEISDKLDFGDVKSHGQTEKHDVVLAINRLFNQTKRALNDREKGSVDDALMHLVKQLTKANGGDINQTKQILTLANREVNDQPKPAQSDAKSEVQYQPKQPQDGQFNNQPDHQN